MMYTFETLKKYISIALLLLVNFSFLFNVGVMLWFQVQKKVIVTEMCVQKEAEENTCQGCCVLNENLLQTDHEDEQAPAINVDLEWLIFVLPSKCAFYDGFTLLSESPPIDNNILEGVHSNTFHPPPLLV